MYHVRLYLSKAGALTADSGVADTQTDPAYSLFLLDNSSKLYNMTTLPNVPVEFQDTVATKLLKHALQTTDNNGDEDEMPTADEPTADLPATSTNKPDHLAIAPRGSCIGMAYTWNLAVAHKASIWHQKKVDWSCAEGPCSEFWGCHPLGSAVTLAPHHPVAHVPISLCSKCQGEWLLVWTYSLEMVATFSCQSCKLFTIYFFAHLLTQFLDQSSEGHNATHIQLITPFQWSCNLITLIGWGCADKVSGVRLGTNLMAKGSFHQIQAHIQWGRHVSVDAVYFNLI